MSLVRYKKRRNFTKTPEPKAKITKGKNIFVIQKHLSKRPHYDFRIQIKNTLKSWVVPKGMPKVLKQRKLAILTEDHPLKYAKFEGIIPKGEYGAGKVLIWDSGNFENIKKDKNGKKISIDQSFKNGQIEFFLHGKRLNSCFALIRYKDNKTWLLIKMKNTKNFKIKKQPDFIMPELATLTDKYFSDKNWIFEEKFDGIRCLVVKKGKNVVLFTRNKNILNSTYPNLVEQFKKQKIKNFILDGEIVAFEKGRTSFSKLQQVKRKKIKVYIYVFDLLYFDKYDLRDQKLIDRKNILKKNFHFTNTFRYAQHIVEKGLQCYKKACKRGWEGVIAKNKNSKYLSKRTKDWLKFKCSNRQEFVVAGYTDPEGQRVGFGALLIGYFEKKEFRYAGKVGTGYDVVFLQNFSEKLKKIQTKNPPFKEKVSLKNKHFVKLKYVVEIGFCEWTKYKKLRHPRFLGLRIDKNPKEVFKES